MLTDCCGHSHRNLVGLHEIYESPTTLWVSTEAIPLLTRLLVLLQIGSCLLGSGALNLTWSAMPVVFKHVLKTHLVIQQTIHSQHYWVSQATYVRL